MNINNHQLLDMWLKERTIQNQSEHTIHAYQRDLTDFFMFCEVKKLDLIEIEASDLREYLAYIALVCHQCSRVGSRSPCHW